MALSVVVDWESVLQPAGIPLVQKNAWICLRAASSSLGNNPSLQNHSFYENRGECNQTCEHTGQIFSSALMWEDLHIADNIFIPWNEARHHTLSLWSLLYQFLAGKANPMGVVGRCFFAEIFIKRWTCSKSLCLICCMLSARRLELMISSLSWIDFNFQSSALGFNTRFPRNFSVLHHNSMETSWLSLTKHESLFTEEKSMQPSSDTRVSMLILSFWCRSASAL